MNQLLAPLRRYPWIPPCVLLAMVVAGALLAPWISPQNPYDLKAVRLEDSYFPPLWLRSGYVAEGKFVQPARRPDDPGLTFPLGSDRNGRDTLSAILYGLRVSLLVGVCGTGLALGIGVTLGLLAGYHGGRADAIIMRLADAQLAFPSLLIALFMMAIWGPGVGKIIFAVAVVHWVIYARVVRGEVLSEREKDYISAVRALGARAPRILFLHLLPNMMGPIIVVSAVQFASIVMLEATLSYLGLGAPETRPSLGMLIKFGYEDFFSGRWWVWFFPGLALAVLVVAINWLADVLRYVFEFEGE